MLSYIVLLLKISNFIVLILQLVFNSSTMNSVLNTLSKLNRKENNEFEMDDWNSDTIDSKNNQASADYNTNIPPTYEPLETQCNCPSIKNIVLILSIYHDCRILSNIFTDEFLYELISPPLSISSHMSSAMNSSTMSKYDRYLCEIFDSLKSASNLKINFKIHEQLNPKKLGIYLFINKYFINYDSIQLLNDFHHLLRYHKRYSTNEYLKHNISNSNIHMNKNKCGMNSFAFKNIEECMLGTFNFDDMFEYVCERIGKCALNKCSYIKQHFNGNIKSDYCKKEQMMIATLNEIHCWLFHTSDLHRFSSSVGHLRNDKKILSPSSTAVEDDDEIFLVQSPINPMQNRLSNFELQKYRNMVHKKHQKLEWILEKRYFLYLSNTHVCFYFYSVFNELWKICHSLL